MTPVFSISDLTPLWPAVVLSAAAIVVLLAEVLLPNERRGYQAVLSAAGALFAGALAVGNAFEAARPVFGGMGVLDPFSSGVSAVVCLALFLAVLLSRGFLVERHAERGEYYALMLFAGAGMSLLSLSSELITLFVSLEVLSISTYALTSYLRRGLRPAEAAFKYFILGAFSSALLLYGASLWYGVTGTTLLGTLPSPVLREAWATQPGLATCALLLMGAGLSFKVAAVPFHMWAPDVYVGAPTPVTALMSAGVKAAAFAALVRVALSVSGGVPAELLSTFFAVLALLTMVAGNLLALPQRNVKRMLAYSSIAHAGYLLLGVASLFGAPAGGEGVLAPAALVGGQLLGQSEALKGILFYLLGYTVSAVGAFGALSALERREDEERGTAWDLERFAGLAQARPALAVAMGAFMVSLAGIPPTVGFLGKLLVFKSAVSSGLLSLAVVGILASAAGAYYYLRVVVYMFMRPQPASGLSTARPFSTQVALALSLAAVVLLGVAPGLVSRWTARGGSLWQAHPASATAPVSQR